MKFENYFKTLNPKYKEDPDMRETPMRVEKMYKHFFRNEDARIHFNKTFPTSNNEMIILKNINVIGLCPHHLMPIEYKIHIGYIPNGFALGLSKFNRICKAVASYPKLQENLTHEICNLIQNNLKCMGVIVVVKGIHGCIKFRGVEDCSDTITSQISGIYQMNPEAKREALSIIYGV